MRVATVDIGTNTVLLLVAERRDDGALVAVSERARVTRLGEQVDRTRRFSRTALLRTKTCLEEYSDLVKGLHAERVAVVGTSAMRDAAGGEELEAHIRASFGVAVRVLSGNEEARLTFRGALGGLRSVEVSQVAVFDIGGGSTEVVIGGARVDGGFIEYSESFDVGSVRLTERHVRHDPPTHDERERLRRASREVFAAVPPLPNDAAPIGLAGTMTTLAAVSLGLEPYDGARVHGRQIARVELQRVVDMLATKTIDERRRVPGMEPSRADVIAAGGHIAMALLEHWSARDVIVSDRGLRWGLAEELAEMSTCS